MSTCPINVKLLDSFSAPLDGIKISAATCTSRKWVTTPPKKMDAKKALLGPGHTMPIEGGGNVLFSISGILVSLCTEGFHSYNSYSSGCQQSGRASKMYEEPNFETLAAYLDFFWGKDVSEAALKKVNQFVQKGFRFYNESIDAAIKLAKEIILIERPRLPEDKVDAKAESVAQEQLRAMFSTGLPCNYTPTIPILTLAQLDRCAWSRGLKYTVGKMKDALLEKHPELHILFEEDYGVDEADLAWSPEFLSTDHFFSNSSSVELETKNLSFVKTLPPAEKIAHLDPRLFHPKYAEYRRGIISYIYRMPLMTMSQSHRHRTLKRGMPAFTGGFVIPFIMRELGLHDRAQEINEEFLSFVGVLPNELVTSIAPYAAEVTYWCSGTPLEVAIEMSKRFCFNAQGDIRNLAKSLWQQFKEAGMGREALESLLPFCLSSGGCPEGIKFCGRDPKSNILLETRI